MQYICCSPLENYIQTKNIYIPKRHEHEYLLCAYGDTLESCPSTKKDTRRIQGTLYGSFLVENHQLGGWGIRDKMCGST
jgi:hypothetical protein